MKAFTKLKRQVCLVAYGMLLIYLCRACVAFYDKVFTGEVLSSKSRAGKFGVGSKVRILSKGPVKLQRKNYGSNSSSRGSFESYLKGAKLKQTLDKNPTILIWTAPSKFERTGIEFITDANHGSCKVTMDRSNLRNSVAVVIFNNNKKLEQMDVPNPNIRNRDQSFVFWTIETPAKTFRFKHLLQNRFFKSKFNLSMSMMPTADIQIAFGSFRRALEKSRQLKLSTHKSSVLWKKKKHAVWAVSNCYGLPAVTERLLLAKSLVKAGLKLDKFGKCFGNSAQTLRTSKYFQDYKFYLAFENSYHCPSYVTEKFWRNSLEYGLVPVVWGPTREDVRNVAPPNSFIFAEDFKKPLDLVRYLNYLNRNYTAYMEYHRWRDTPMTLVPDDNVAVGHIELFSKLCRRLRRERHAPKTIESITNLIYETQYTDKKCLRPFDNNLTEKERKDASNF